MDGHGDWHGCQSVLSCFQLLAEVLMSLSSAVFDNFRVLHGRSSFTGERRLCGAYVAADDYRSRLRGLEKQFKKP